MVVQTDTQRERLHEESKVNLANFNLLADCVSSLANQERLGPYRLDRDRDSEECNYSVTNSNKERESSTTCTNSNSNSDPTSTSNSHSSSSTALLSFTDTTSTMSVAPGQSVAVTPSVPPVTVFNDDDEFVCIIRTEDSHFAPFFATQPLSDIRMFLASSVLSASSIKAHNASLSHSDGERESPHGSVTGSNKSGVSSDVISTSISTHSSMQLSAETSDRERPSSTSHNE